MNELRLCRGVSVMSLELESSVALDNVDVVLTFVKEDDVYR